MAGYSKTPLVKKLGIKEGHAVSILNAPENYLDTLRPLPENLVFNTEKNLDFIQLFTNKIEELEELFPLLANKIVSNGMIWISWYKKSSKLPSELDEGIIRNTGLGLGLVDVKVCAVDNNWSGLKFVIPLKNRPG